VAATLPPICIPFPGQIFFSYFLSVLFQIVRSGEATKIDEYVPTTIPTMSVNEKNFVDSGPKKYNATSDNTVVSDVLIERVNV
jgi:hypothetical protein